MPTRPPLPCPRCRIVGCSPACRAIKREARRRYDRSRGSSSERGYGAEWRKLRAAILRRDPWCTDCGQEKSTEVDHVVPKSEGGTDDPRNLRGMCKSCHSRKTALQDGRWG
jgi:5-methylcytosine-specific restriction protein A